MDENLSVIKKYKVPVILGILFTVALLFFIFLDIPLIGNPFGVEREEGVLLDGAGRLCRGGSLYTDLGRTPFVIDRYGPVFPYLCGHLLEFSGLNFFGGRLLSFLSTLGSSFLIVWILWKYGWIALLGAAFFLSAEETIEIGSLYRPEMAGIFLGLLSLAIALKGGRFRLLALLPAVLGVFTDPFSIAGTVAAGFVLFQHRRRDGVIFSSVFLFLCVSFFIVAGEMTGGLYFQHVYPFGTFDFRGENLWNRFGRSILLRFAPALFLALYALLKWSKKSNRAFLIYGITAMGVGIAAGYENMDWGLIAGAIAGLSVLMVCGIKAAEFKYITLSLIVAQCLFNSVYAGNKFFPTPLRDAFLKRDKQVLKILSNEEESHILSDVNYYPAMLSGGLVLDPKSYHVCVDRGYIDERITLDLLKNGYFKAAVLRNYIEKKDGKYITKPVGDEDITPPVREKIKEVMSGRYSFKLKRTPTLREDMVVYFKKP